MKSLPILFLFFLVTGCSKEDTFEKPADHSKRKTVIFSISARQDYGDPAYDPVKAYVRIYIRKESRKTPIQTTPLWDTTIAARPIGDYPFDTEPPIVFSKNITGIIDSLEVVKVVSSVRYLRNEQESSHFTVLYEVRKGDTTLRVYPRI